MKRFAVLVALSILAGPAVARADSILITGGSLVMDWTSMNRVSFDVNGTGQTRLAGTWDAAILKAATCNPCTTGFVVSPDLTLSNTPRYELTMARGTATVNDTAYPAPDFTYGFVEFGGLVEIKGQSAVVQPVPATPDNMGRVLRQAYELPFTMTGVIAGYDNSVYAGPREVFSLAVQGQGTVSLELLGAMSQSGETFWNFYRATYNFAPGEPVPEPASLLLIGSGLAGMVLRARRRRAKGDV